jgi:uncharacterized protein (TIGR04255 family)
MLLGFPSFDHQPLRHPPLKEVICQVRFPSILEIGQKLRTEFQESVRSRFPFFEIEQPTVLTTSTQLLPVVYHFRDLEKVRTLTLSQDFFAVSTTQYTDWSNFLDDLRFGAQATIDVYKPEIATRIGLRYVNMLNTVSTGVTNFSEILSMLQPKLTTVFTITELGELTQGITRLFTQQSGYSFALLSGIVTEEEFPSFVLDIDHYTELSQELKIESLLELCEQFHVSIYNAFRWCFLLDNLDIFNKE